MCGRLTLSSDYKKVESLLEKKMNVDQIDYFNDLFPNYNGAPTQFFPVLANSNDESHFSFMKWGLIPFWAKDEKIAYKTINARAESVMEKPSFRAAFSKRRCLIAVDGYYEWKKESADKQPYRICLEDESVFALCGLWERWKKPGTESILETFTIITMPSSGPLSSIHDRMPLSISEKLFEVWLTNEFSKKDWEEFFREHSTLFSNFYKVSKSVNYVRNNFPELIERTDG